MGLDWALGIDGIDSLDVEGLTQRVLGYQGSCQRTPIKNMEKQKACKTPRGTSSLVGKLVVPNFRFGVEATQKINNPK